MECLLYKSEIMQKVLLILILKLKINKKLFLTFWISIIDFIPNYTFDEKKEIQQPMWKILIKWLFKVHNDLSIKYNY